MLESRIEQAFGSAISSWALAEGMNLAYVKFSGAKGWPDRILTWGTPDRVLGMIWIEWKAKGEKPRPMQVHIHKQLRGMGHDVRIYDDHRLALDTIQEEIRASFRADKGDEVNRI